jgi:hypothetical protein
MTSIHFDKFPTSFNFKIAKDRIEQTYIEAESRKAREYIMSKYEKAIERKQPYFSITLADSEYTAKTKISIIQELIQSFPNIGYNPRQAETPEEQSYKNMIARIYSTINNNQPISNEFTLSNIVDKLYKIEHATLLNKNHTMIRLTNPVQAANAIYFFIALTDETSNKLETYSW